MRRAALLSSLMLSLLWVGTAQGQEPMLGARLVPSVLTMDGQTSTQVTNLGNIPVTVTASAKLLNFPATGYRVKVHPKTLQPEQTATVTLTQLKRADPSDLTLDIGMSPSDLGGMDTTSLRFPLPVENEQATTETTIRALVRAILDAIT